MFHTKFLGVLMTNLDTKFVMLGCSGPLIIAITPKVKYRILMAAMLMLLLIRHVLVT